MKLIFVTGNKHKLEEAKMILDGFEIINKNVELPELQGKAEDIVREKARMAFAELGRPCFVEDTSLSFNAWNGLPGPYIKDFVERIGVENLPSLLEGKDRAAMAVSSIGYVDKEGVVHCFQGVVNGRIVEAAGRKRFDWDCIFKPGGYEKRFSEMGLEEKNSISHRRKAFEKFKEFLASD